jgi:hypothetical protein
MTFLATDRCDRCMAQAVASADSLNWATTLLFCLHHAREHSAALSGVGAILISEEELEWTH